MTAHKIVGFTALGFFDLNPSTAMANNLVVWKKAISLMVDALFLSHLSENGAW
jgi:hypothetical protein